MPLFSSLIQSYPVCSLQVLIISIFVVCDWHPCLNGGTCVIDEVGYHCECTDCWTGSCCNVTAADCQTNIAPCPPCKEGPNCQFGEWIKSNAGIV